jgi:hypothetical protein
MLNIQAQEERRRQSVREVNLENPTLHWEGTLKEQ